MAIASINPATQEVLRRFESLTEGEIEQKLALAHSAFKLHRDITFHVRARRMLKAAEILESRWQDGTKNSGKQRAVDRRKPL